MKLHTLTALEAGALIRRGDILFPDLTKALLKRIDRVDSTLGSFISPRTSAHIMKSFPDKTDKPKNLNENRVKPQSELWGVPFGVQDNISVKGMEITCGSKILKDYISPYDASSIAQLKREGAIVLGKLNMDEFSMGFSTENSVFGPTLNPWDRSKIAGGAGGGCAAAVASNQIFYAIGSDMAGCLRQPASFSGVVGLKPTYGLISRYGLVATAPSLEQIGIIAKDVRDCESILGSIAFYDKRDATSIERPPIVYDSHPRKGRLKGVRVGIPHEIFRETWDSQVKRSIDEAMNTLEELGAEFVDVRIPHLKYASEAHFIIMCKEAAGSLSRYDGIRYGYSIEGAKGPEDLYKKVRGQAFGREVKARIMLGNLFLGTGYHDTHYIGAQRVRGLLVKDFEKAYKSCHIIMTPTCPNTAYSLQDNGHRNKGMDRSHDYTLPANLTGLPAISLPCGFSRSGLPIGMQFMGRPFDEGLILRCARIFEENTQHHMKRPPEQEVGL